MILHSKQNAIEGAKMGFMIGGLFGFMLGCYSAVQTRRFMVIPISTIASGASFGFLLGCGSAIRQDEVDESPDSTQMAEGEWQQVMKFNKSHTL